MILPKILILIPVWKRPDITEICFAGLSRLGLHRANIEVLAVISEVDYVARCKRYNIPYTFFENQPLGAKKNHGLKIALERDWDYLMELNSDDVIKNELLDIYDSMDDDYLALRNFCFLDSKTLSLRQIETKTAYGIARRYSRKAVESCKVKKVKVKKSLISGFGAMKEGCNYDVKPYIADDLSKAGYADIISEGVRMWNDEASAGMDNFSNLRLNDNGYFVKQVFTDEPLAVDIKSDVNIWKFNPEAGIEYDLNEFVKDLPELDGFINKNRINVLSS